MAADIMCIDCGAWSVGLQCASCGATKPKDAPKRGGTSLPIPPQELRAAPNAQSLRSVPQPEPIRCRKCGSTQIAAGGRGFGIGKAAVGGLLLGPVGLVAGALGSSALLVTCLKCGARWKPGT